MSRREYTHKEIATIRSLVHVMTHTEIGEILGRTKHSVEKKAFKIKATHYRKWNQKDSERLIRLHGFGYSDEDISLKMDREAKTIWRWRTRLGLPSHRYGKKTREKIRRSMKRYWREQRCPNSARRSGSNGSPERSRHCEPADLD